MNQLKRIDFGGALYFGTIFYVTFFGTRFFGTNDDLLMMLFTSGIYNGEPTEYITFQNIIIGLTLKNLYLTYSNINWYILLLSSIQIISFATLYVLIKPLTNKATQLCLFTLPLLYFLIEMSLYLQFTKVAFLSSTVGVLLIVKYFYENKNIYLLTATIFLSVGLLIREYSMYGALVLALPILSFLSLKYKTKIINKNFMIFVFSNLAIFFSLVFFNNYYYENSSKEMKFYKNMLTERGAIYFNRSITKDCFEQYGATFGITNNDVQTFYKWTNDHNDTYTPEMLAYVSKNCGKGFFMQNKKIFSLHHINRFFEKLSSFQSSYLLLCCLFLLLIFDKKHIKYLLLYYIYFIGILFFINTMTFDNRVVSSLILELYLLLLTTALIINPNFKNLKSIKYVFPILTIFLLITYYNIYEKTVYKKTPFPIQNEISTLQGNYVIVSKSRNFFSYLPLDTDFRGMFKNTKFYYLGWNLSSPDNVKALDGQSNFYELMLQKNNVILYVDAHRLPVIKTFVAEHYGKEIEFKKLKGDYYTVSIVN